MDRDRRLTGFLRGQTDKVEAPPGFELNNPWRVSLLAARNDILADILCSSDREADILELDVRSTLQMTTFSEANLARQRRDHSLDPACLIRAQLDTKILLHGLDAVYFVLARLQMLRFPSDPPLHIPSH